MTLAILEAQAKKLDDADTLSGLRSEFYFPQIANRDALYFAGNSLGLQPKGASALVEQELNDWRMFGVEGHLEAKNPWLSYHEILTESLGRIVGALSTEVVAMNTLTVNLHLLLVSFYRPTAQRFKIIIEAGAFPSDQYAVSSQVRFHGFDSSQAIVELTPRPGEDILRTDDILKTLEAHRDSCAVLLLGQVNYLTGQAYDVPALAEACQKLGIIFGLDLAHGAGNLELKLHDWKVDFACWCSYKYLNGGPGTIAGVFVHEKHARNFSGPRFEGWWGHNKERRFLMESKFSPIEGVEAWQLSNPPIFQMAALRASLNLFDRATMPALRKKSLALASFADQCFSDLLGERVRRITPSSPADRGTQLSLRVKGSAKSLVGKLKKDGAICDAREPDIVRVAPVALYTRFCDVLELARLWSAHV